MTSSTFVDLARLGIGIAVFLARASCRGATLGCEIPVYPVSDSSEIFMIKGSPLCGAVCRGDVCFLDLRGDLWICWLPLESLWLTEGFLRPSRSR